MLVAWPICLYGTYREMRVYGYVCSCVSGRCGKSKLCILVDLSIMGSRSNSMSRFRLGSRSRPIIGTATTVCSCIGNNYQLQLNPIYSIQGGSGQVDEKHSYIMVYILVVYIVEYMQKNVYINWV